MFTITTSTTLLMLIILTFLSLTTSSSFHTQIPFYNVLTSQTSSSSSPITLTTITESIFDILIYNSSFNLLLTHGVQNSSCAAALLNTKSHNISNNDILSNIFVYSGLSVLDVGKEDECKGSNMTYFFLTYNMNYTKDSYLSKYFTFVEEQSFYKGICLPKQCTELFVKIFNMSENIQFNTTLSNLGVNNLKIFSYDYIGNELFKSEKYNFKYKMKSLNILIITISIYITFRIVVTFIYSCLFESTTNTNASTHKLSYYDLLSANDSQNLIFKKSKIIKDKNRNKMCYKMLSFLSLDKNSKVLLMKKASKFYNEDGIKPLSGLKVISLFFVTISHNSWAISKLPHKDLSVISTYNSIWFAVVKFSIFSFESLKIINGISFGFKLMSYLKKNIKHLSFKTIIRFYLNCLPQIVAFIITTLCLHLYTMEIGLLINPSAEYEYFINKTVINNYDCVQNPFNIFKPFYYQYFYNPHSNNTTSSSSNTVTCMKSCFKNIHFILCEFYCVLFIVFLTYIYTKLQSIVIEVIVYLLSLCLIFTFTLSYDSNIPYTDYTISKIYGSDLPFTQPHLFFVVYFIGVNLGMMVYFYHDLSSDNTSVIKTYIPFKYNFYLCKFYSKMLFCGKMLLWVVSIILIMLVTFNFTLFGLVFNRNNDIIVQENYWMRFTYQYEGFIFGIAFGMFVLFILIGELNVKNFLSNNLFSVIGRVGTAYFLLDNFYVSVFHAFYRIDIYLNVKNVVFMSVPLAIMNVMLSICFVILVEMPIKRLLQTITGSNEDEDKKQLISGNSMKMTVEDGNESVKEE